MRTLVLAVLFATTAPAALAQNVYVTADRMLDVATGTMIKNPAIIIQDGVITSVGSPEPVIEPLHKIGCLVLADMASLRHARKAVEAGADGLVLLSAGAGGQTGWVNGLAFVRAVRRFFDGPLVLAGGMADGQALWASRVLGCDLGYMGTKFIATSESLAAPAYKQMLLDAELDDVLLGVSSFSVQ